MRSYFPPNLHKQTTPIELVPFQLHCRHELLPILVGLQHIYQRTDICQQLLHLIEKDINKNSSPRRGRQGLSYWEILVLAGVRLGCNLNYDALHDLAVNHRTLQQIMGVADDPLDLSRTCPYKWHRLRDNICRLQPATIEEINKLIVRLGHELDPTGALHVRGDTFVVETNIHYPTESSLLDDGLRKILALARELAKQLGLPGWRQYRSLARRIKKAVRRVTRACRSKRPNAEEEVRTAYQGLYDLADQVLVKGQQLARQVTAQLSSGSPLATGTLGGLAEELQTYLNRTAQVAAYSKRRVLQGEKIANSDKLFSMFETDTQLINRGKMPHPIQFGHGILVIEEGVGFIGKYQILGQEETDKTIVVGATQGLQVEYKNSIESASFDKGFHSPENQQEMAKVVPVVCIPMPGNKQGKAQAQTASPAFQEARRAHPGIESLIGVLQRSNGLKRCRDRGRLGYDRYVGLGILGRNLHILGKLVLSQRDPDCLAARSKRKPYKPAA